MSYMYNQKDFDSSPVIFELTSDEIDTVDGGLPMLVGVAIALYGPAAVKAAVAGTAAAVGFAAIYLAAHDD